MHHLPLHQCTGHVSLALPHAVSRQRLSPLTAVPPPSQVRFLEVVDLMVGQLLRRLWEAQQQQGQGPFLLAVTGDHSTPVVFGDHSHEPVPFAAAHVQDVVGCWGGAGMPEGAALAWLMFMARCATLWQASHRQLQLCCMSAWQQEDNILGRPAWGSNPRPPSSIAQHRAGMDVCLRKSLALYH